MFFNFTDVKKRETSNENKKEAGEEWITSIPISTKSSISTVLKVKCPAQVFLIISCNSKA